jgi:putative transposase
MPGRQAAKVELSETVRQALETLAARHTTGQQKAQRAPIVWKAAEGQTQAESARELKIAIDRATWWRERWLALAAIGLDALSVEERLDD